MEGETGDDGRFSAPKVGAGTWGVEICAPGYRPMNGTIEIDPKTPIDSGKLVAIAAARAAADRITVLEPSSIVGIDVGTPVHVRWRIENGPVDRKGWEVRVSILGCAAGIGTWIIYTEPFNAEEGGFTWHATKDVVNWMKTRDDSNEIDASEVSGSEEDSQFPIMVCLYDAAGRGQPLGQLRPVDDESLAHLEACHPFGDPSWIVCGATVDDGGKGRLAVTARKGLRKTNMR
jgi:hypothetical protein